MAVEPDRQRRGIGRRLMDHAAEVARSSSSKGIRLDAYDARAGAGGFYVKCGFREVGRVVYRGVPLVYFEMLLSESWLDSGPPVSARRVTWGARISRKGPSA
jgi:ribosomal protein S18 acetylase RimI-like enzyme